MTDEVKNPDVNVKEIIDSVTLKDNDNKEEINETIQKESNNTIKEEIEQVQVDQEPTEEESEKVKELYSEFSSFLETKADITAESGTKATVSTGIDLLDAVLGGGFAIGALNIIVGQPGSGKSMIAMQTLGQAQRQFQGSLIGAFLDSEEATTTIRLSNLGVRYPKIRPYSDITVEKVFKFLEGLSVFKQEKKLVDTPSVVIWDSIANTLSQKEREAEDINSVIGYKARMLSILVPKYVAKCAQNNICFIAVNQLRDVLQMGQFSAPRDLKMMSSNKDMPGGNVLKFNAFQLVEMKVKSLIKDDDAAKYGFEGFIGKAKCVKNKLFPPNVEIELVGSFTAGFSNFWTNYNFLKNTKRLSTGAWNYLISLPDKKFRTKDAPQLYKTDNDFKKAYDAAVKEAITTEVIEKYNPEI